MDTVEKDYNTRRPQMVIPEYGRNIQKMVEHAINTEDRDERNKIANAIISVMGQLNPHLRDIADFKHKLWDHLFIISDYKLDVDSPYPVPEREVIMQKPEKMNYPKTDNRFKHYGKSVVNLINKAIELPDGDEKEALIGIIVNLMKKSYLTFNQDSVNDEQILNDLDILSQGKIKVSENINIVSTSEILAMSKKRKPAGNNRKQGGKNKQKKRRY